MNIPLDSNIVLSWRQSLSPSKLEEASRDRSILEFKKRLVSTFLVEANVVSRSDGLARSGVQDEELTAAKSSRSKILASPAASCRDRHAAGSTRTPPPLTPPLRRVFLSFDRFVATRRERAGIPGARCVVFVFEIPPSIPSHYTSSSLLYCFLLYCILA